MSFGTGNDTAYQQFVAKYELEAGFGGLLNLKNAFDGLLDDTSFVRDRVSSSCTHFEIDFETDFCQ